MLIAVALAAVLGLAWAWRGWADLAALRLPDTDDLMRLQQVRDWLAGQGFADLTQHRLGTGLPMHWTRLADLMPALGIAALTPLLGVHAAEVATIAVVPVLLFAAALVCVTQIARALCADSGIAGVIAGIAYPATTIFAPGRIDHHGLQMVLLLAAVLAGLRRGAGAGFAAGMLAAASLVIGLETAPLLAVLGIAAVAGWIADGRGAWLQGLGIGALAGLAIGKGVFAPAVWQYPACDGFTATAWRAAVVLAAVPLALSILSPRLAGWRARSVAAAMLGGGAGAAALAMSPGCLHPYGAIDPLLLRVWLAHVGEAQPLFAATPEVAIGYAGVMVAGLAATGWAAWRTRSREWLTMVAMLLAALAVTLMQLRGAYAGALLAAPGLSWAIGRARARGTAALAGAWAASAGMLYPLAAQALVRAPVAAAGEGAACTTPALLARLATLPPGLVIAPIDAGAAILTMTRHRVVGAPYHRNDAGNLALYRFYAGTPASAQRVARQWRVDYALVCGAMPGRARAGTAAAALTRGALPGWHRVGPAIDGAAIAMRDQSRRGPI